MLPLGAEGAGRSAREQRHVRVLSDPLLPHSLPPEHHRRTSGAVKRAAIFGVAGGLEYRHADRRETVARDEGTQIVQMPAEPVDMTPDMTPLLLFGGLASHSEGLEGTKGDHIVGEE